MQDTFSLTNGFTLINSEQRQTRYPETWSHPSGRVLDAIRPGDFVKVGIECPDMTGINGERFRTRVVEISNAGFVVEVDNILLMTDDHGLKYGDRLVVGCQHILDVYGDVEMGLSTSEETPNECDCDLCRGATIKTATSKQTTAVDA